MAGFNVLLAGKKPGDEGAIATALKVNRNLTDEVAVQIVKIPPVVLFADLTRVQARDQFHGHGDIGFKGAQVAVVDAHQTGTAGGGDAGIFSRVNLNQGIHSQRAAQGVQLLQFFRAENSHNQQNGVRPGVYPLFQPPGGRPQHRVAYQLVEDINRAEDHGYAGLPGQPQGLQPVGGDGVEHDNVYPVFPDGASYQTGLVAAPGDTAQAGYLDEAGVPEVYR